MTRSTQARLRLAAGAALLALAIGAPVLDAPVDVERDAVIAAPGPAGLGPAHLPGAGSPFEGGGWGDDTTKESLKASRLTGRWKARADLGSLHSPESRIGAANVWKTKRAGALVGTGVGVALLDTGIATVAGLDAPGKVVRGPDLSFDAQVSGTRELDGFGHGTHISGIIAGRDPVKPGEEAKPDYVIGVAPGATLIDVKVGAADGATDVSQVIAGIDWVVTNRATHNIRVLNLSYGTRATQPYGVDPLAKAVENAWDAGIVVVVSAGNDGAGTALTMPAADPRVLAVGAVDHLGTAKTDDDRVASFSSSGTTRRPDLVAPGKSVVSLRAPNSTADRWHSEGRVTGDDRGRLFRGSGTSQAAAVVSGAAALLLQAEPGLTPDQVKALLLAGANPLAGSDPAQGAGVLDVESSVQLLQSGSSARYRANAFPASTGLGSLESSRATAMSSRPTPAGSSRVSGTSSAGRGCRRRGCPPPCRVARGRAIPGTARRGRATGGPTTPGPATDGRATAGRATAGRATAGPPATSWTAPGPRASPAPTRATSGTER